MRRILITAMGGDVACAIIRCLGGTAENLIYGTDIKRYTPYADVVRKAFLVPPYSSEGYGDCIRDLIVEYQITHFLPVSEEEILLADEKREWFAEHGVKLLVNNGRTIGVCTSKFETSRFLRENGIDAPVTFMAEDYEGQLGYPFVMKPDRGCGGRHLRLVRNIDEWGTAEKRGMVCQQMVGTPDSEYTIGVFSDGKTTNSITLKRRLGYGGLSAEVVVCDIPEIDSVARKVAAVLGLRGSINIQMREQDGRYFIFEINPRLSSTTGFRHKFGFADAVWWLDMVDGKTIGAFENNSVGMVGVKVLDDVVLSPRGGYFKAMG